MDVIVLGSVSNVDWFLKHCYLHWCDLKAGVYNIIKKIDISSMGYVEGFYGKLHTWSNRKRLVRKLSKNNMKTNFIKEHMLKTQKWFF